MLPGKQLINFCLFIRAFNACKSECVYSFVCCLYGKKWHEPNFIQLINAERQIVKYFSFDFLCSTQVDSYPSMGEKKKKNENVTQKIFS